MTEGFQILCQVCGAPSPSEARFCVMCNAPLEITFREREAREQLEAIQRKLPPEARERARVLEEQIATGTAKPAIYLQLSNLYRDYKIRDKAIQHLRRATELAPENAYFRQKLNLLVSEGRPIEERIVELETREVEVRKTARVLYAAIGAVVLVAALVATKALVFPSTYRVAASKGNTVGVKFSPDGERLAYLEIPKYDMLDLNPAFGKDLSKTDSKLIVADLRGQEPRMVAQFASHGFAYAGALEFQWVPGTTWIVFLRWKDFAPMIVAVDVATGKETELARGTGPTFSHDGRYMAYLATGEAAPPEAWKFPGTEVPFWMYWREEATELRLFDLKTRTSTVIMSGEIETPRFSPTANVLIYSKKAAAAAVAPTIDLSSEEGASVFLEAMEDRWHLAGNIFKYDINSRLEQSLTSDNLASEPRWTPDGKWIVYTAYVKPDEYKTVLRIMDESGARARQLLGPSVSYESFGKVSFSYDGKLMAFEGQFVNPNRPNLPGKMSPIGMIGGGANVQTDVFVMDMVGTGLRRLDAEHKFKHNPEFHPTSYRLAYEISLVDNRLEAWITKAVK